jgi:hypothetical protein
MVVLAIVVQIGTWGITAGALVLLWLISGRPERLTADSGVALTAGMGALMLAAGLFNGDLIPGKLRAGPQA